MRMAITALGEVSAVGRGATGTCAAIRAGLALPELLDFEAGDGEGNSEPVMGYPVRHFSEGFFQTGAWVRLASGSIQDLRRSGELESPSSAPLWRAATLLAALPLVQLDRFQWSLETMPDAPEEFFMRPLLDLELPEMGPGPHAWHALGHVSLAAALRRADAILANRRCDRILIAAADSYVDPLSLGWLASAERLKTGERPVGLMPGEAGTALLVESENAARQRKAPVLGFIEASAVDRVVVPATFSMVAKTEEEAKDVTPQPWYTPIVALGRALAEVVQRVLPASANGGRFRGDLYLDLNGEEWKAHAWGHAQIHLSKLVDLDRCRVFLPATSLGETGAASAPLALGLALWNFNRDCTDQALVFSMADDGVVSAIRLSAPRELRAQGRNNLVS